jgi:tRNA(Ile)-lysidine synthase
MSGRKRSILAISGGSDSRYLLELLKESGEDVILAHVNHGTRGKDSEKDQEFVEEVAREAGRPCVTARMESRGGAGNRARSDGETVRIPPGFENRARQYRRRFLLEAKERFRAGEILLAHTADDQVETILMRFFRGLGIAGLKGIPGAADGFRHPILHVWREDIERFLDERNISAREDRTNSDTRFERNWVRHVLIPLLVRRYGDAVKKRIHALGERFRELDEYLDSEAGAWLGRNVRSTGRRSPGRGKTGRARPGGGAAAPDRPTAHDFRRADYSGLPAVLRVRVLQKLCFERLKLDPGERLLEAMDRIAREGAPSARLKVGKGWEMVNRYGEVRFAPAAGRGGDAVTEGHAAGTLPGTVPPPGAAGSGGAREEGKRIREIAIPGPGSYPLPDPAGDAVTILSFAFLRTFTPARARRGASRGEREFFDAGALRLPLTVRALRAGDRIRPFGLDSEKKVKAVLIDRKVPRTERWGRPAVCDAAGKILWIPGVVRSAHAPVTPRTRKTVQLRVGNGKPREAAPPHPSRPRSRK